MEVHFTDFRFIRDQLVLYKQNEIIPLKRNQALLLDFFITHPDGIHSKEDIMDAVWQEKVVSEQVVFQTISQLRAIFGANAIRTFSKKGYKWELTLHQPSPENSAPENSTIKVTHHKKSQYAFAVSILLICLSILLGAYISLPKTAQAPTALHLISHEHEITPNQIRFSQLAKDAIIESGTFNLKLTQKNTSPRQLFSAPKLAWQQANIPAHTWLMWTETFRSTQGVFLNYGLSRGDTYWYGYVYANDDKQLVQQLSARLSKLQQIGLFNAPHLPLDISTMTSMLNIAPNNPDLLMQLASYYFEVHQLEVAMTYAQKLVNLDTSYGFSPYRAKALWLMAEVYKRHQKYALAVNSLQKMSSTLANTALWALHYEYIHARAWLAKAQNDPETMHQVLKQGLELNQSYPDILTLFELHITYSILAMKTGDDHKKYAHLNEAQALLLKHKLDESNFAVVYYHFVLFTQDPNKAQPYLEKIITLNRTARNGWIIDDATEMLIDQYIAQQQYKPATALLKNQAESPKKTLSLAKIYHATNKHNKARTYFEKAFEQARLDYDHHIASHAALGLYQLSDSQPEKQAEYWDYLERKANKAWLKEQVINTASH